MFFPLLQILDCLESVIRTNHFNLEMAFVWERFKQYVPRFEQRLVIKCLVID